MVTVVVVVVVVVVVLPSFDLFNRLFFTVQALSCGHSCCCCCCCCYCLAIF